MFCFLSPPPAPFARIAHAFVMFDAALPSVRPSCRLHFVPVKSASMENVSCVIITVRHSFCQSFVCGIKCCLCVWRIQGTNSYSLRQILGQLHGGRSWWSDARMSPFGRACHHSAAQGAHAHADHVSLRETGKVGPPTAAHGGRGVCIAHPRSGPGWSQVFGVSFFCVCLFCGG